MSSKLWLAGGAAAIVFLGGCAGSRPGPGQAAPPPECQPASPVPIVTAGATMWPEPPGMSEVLNVIQTAGQDRFRDVYAGVETVPEAGYAIVYRVPSAEYDKLIREASGTQCIEIRDARFSNATLMELQNRISNDREFWKGRGIDINMVGSEHDGSGVTVGTTQVDKAEAEIAKHYKTDIPVKVEKLGPGTLFNG